MSSGNGSVHQQRELLGAYTTCSTSLPDVAAMHESRGLWSMLGCSDARAMADSALFNYLSK